ncbi:MAG: peptidoglycan-binding protein [Lachnospiraceae bacterium]|nr:peptidoglycan-binding protein [Lachnospiraceae bacterium]
MGKIETATQWMINLANDNSHGYDQDYRWGPDYDCASAVITAWEYAGVPVKTNGASYTGDMKSVFLATGFSDVSASCNFNTCAGMQYGDVLHRRANGSGHTAMYVGNNQIVHARSNENGDRTGGQTGDQTGNEICVSSYSNGSSNPWTTVLRYTGENGSGSTPSNLLKKGSTGTAVSELQKKMNILGYGLTVDGSFGDATDAAVRNFQSKNGLAVDGIVGSSTMAKLDEKVAAAQAGQWIQAPDGRWWYRHADGSYTTNGWEKINGKWYYFDASGWMMTGWVLTSGKWYYMDASGAMLSNTWINSMYYVGGDGAMLTNTMTPDGYIVDANGKWDGRDSWVTRLQTALKNAGRYSDAIDGSPGPNTLAACPTLQMDATGIFVTLLQERLTYYFKKSTNGIDDSFGNGTKTAVMSFQSSKGLAADGIVGTNSWRELLKS